MEYKMYHVFSMGFLEGNVFHNAINQILNNVMTINKLIKPNSQIEITLGGWLQGIFSIWTAFSLVKQPLITSI